jgi:hypothetical protein
MASWEDYTGWLLSLPTSYMEKYFCLFWSLTVYLFLCIMSLSRQRLQINYCVPAPCVAHKGTERMKKMSESLSVSEEHL